MRAEQGNRWGNTSTTTTIEINVLREKNEQRQLCNTLQSNRPSDRETRRATKWRARQTYAILNLMDLLFVHFFDSIHATIHNGALVPFVKFHFRETFISFFHLLHSRLIIISRIHLCMLQPRALSKPNGIESMKKWMNEWMESMTVRTNERMKMKIDFSVHS